MSRIEELPDDYTEPEGELGSETSEDLALEGVRERAEIKSILEDKELRVIAGLDEEKRHTMAELDMLSAEESKYQVGSKKWNLLKKPFSKLYTRFHDLVRYAVEQANIIRLRQGRQGFEVLHRGFQDIESGKAYDSDEPLAPLVAAPPPPNPNKGKVIYGGGRYYSRAPYSASRGLQTSRPRDLRTGRFVKRF